jgi:hypothetical protein
MRLLASFNDHADGTNDIFRLAAKVVAGVALGAQRNLEAMEQKEVSGAGSSSSEHRQWSAAQRQDALIAAWQPYAMGHKGLWWECVARPADVMVGREEAMFREEMRRCARESLDLLTMALLPGGLPAAFPALFDLRVWGSIIGMFELVRRACRARNTDNHGKCPLPAHASCIIIPQRYACRPELICPPSTPFSKRITWQSTLPTRWTAGLLASMTCLTCRTRCGC